jgi:hypothetical protein
MTSAAESLAGAGAAAAASAMQAAKIKEPQIRRNASCIVIPLEDPLPNYQKLNIPRGPQIPIAALARLNREIDQRRRHG